MIYLNTGQGLRRVLAEPGRIARIWRDVAWRPISLVVIDDDGMSTHYSLGTYVPRRVNDTWSFDLESYLVGDSRTQLPAQTFAKPVPFTVAQDRYNLRATPVVDDTSADDMGARHGNVMAAYASGSRGVALAERVEGMRTWWLVVMQSTRIGADGDFPALGWMSSRFLVRDTAALKGVVDTLTSGRRSP